MKRNPKKDILSQRMNRNHRSLPLDARRRYSDDIKTTSQSRTPEPLAVYDKDTKYTPIIKSPSIKKERNHWYFRVYFIVFISCSLYITWLIVSTMMNAHKKYPLDEVVSELVEDLKSISLQKGKEQINNLISGAINSTIDGVVSITEQSIQTTAVATTSAIKRNPIISFCIFLLTPLRNILFGFLRLFRIVR